MPYELSKNCKISWLCKQCLDNDWIRSADHLVDEVSVFCKDCELKCDICVCPKIICRDHGVNGLTGILVQKYGKATYVSEIDEPDFQQMRRLLKQHIKK